MESTESKKILEKEEDMKEEGGGKSQVGELKNVNSSCGDSCDIATGSPTAKSKLSFADLRGLFSPSEKHSDERPDVQKGKRKRVENVNLQNKNRRSTKVGQTSLVKGKNGKISVQRTMVNRLKNKARLLAGAASVNSRQNKINQHDESSDGSYIDTSDMSEAEGDNNIKRCNLNDVEISSKALTLLSKELKELTTDELIRRGYIKDDKSNSSINSDSSDIEGMDTEQNIQPNPQAMGIVSVQEMFQQLQKELVGEITSLREEFITFKNQQTKQVSQDVINISADKIIDKVNQAMKKDSQVVKLKDDVKQLSFKNRTLTNVVERMNIEMEEMKVKLENLELNNTKKSVSITGLFTQGKKYEVMRQIEDFFEANLGIFVRVEDFFKLGTNEPRVTIVSFQYMQDKLDVMRFKHFLKDKKNREGRPYYVNDYIPSTTQERRKREQQIVQQAESVDSNPPLDVKFVKGSITIQNETFKPKVWVPTPKELIEIPADELATLLKSPIQSAGSVTQNKSIFQGFAVDVKDFDDIRNQYKRMKILHPTARHIVCAYFLEGNKEPYYTQGFCDDGEPGAGRILLEFLQQNKISSKAVFVTRKFGGIKMGQDRFDCYIQAIKAVCILHPFNKILNCDQPLLSPDEKLQQQARKRDYPKKSTVGEKSSKRPLNPPLDPW